MRKAGLIDRQQLQALCRWWWGWGVRYYGQGWLYNVSGLDAVEIRLKSGKHIRIGTDEPEALVAEIRDHQGQHTDA